VELEDRVLVVRAASVCPSPTRRPPRRRRPSHALTAAGPRLNQARDLLVIALDRTGDPRSP